MSSVYAVILPHVRISLSGLPCVSHFSICTVTSCSPFPQYFSIPYGKKNVPIHFIMSLTGRATSSSSSNAQLIINALAEYSKDTGIDPSSHPFATALEQSDSPEAILQLLQQREKAFKEYREGNRRLINCLSPAVKVLQAFSGILGEAVSLVSYTFCLMDLL